MHLISGYNTSRRFMLLFYGLLVQCAKPFHSNPAFPESDRLAVGDSGVPRNFFFGGGSTNSVEDREDGDLGAVAP